MVAVIHVVHPSGKPTLKRAETICGANLFNEKQLASVSYPLLTEARI